MAPDVFGPRLPFLTVPSGRVTGVLGWLDGDPEGFVVGDPDGPVVGDPDGFDVGDPDGPELLGDPELLDEPELLGVPELLGEPELPGDPDVLEDALGEPVLELPLEELLLAESGLEAAVLEVGGGGELIAEHMLSSRASNSRMATTSATHHQRRHGGRGSCPAQGALPSSQPPSPRRPRQWGSKSGPDAGPPMSVSAAAPSTRRTDCSVAPTGSATHAWVPEAFAPSTCPGSTRCSASASATNRSRAAGSLDGPGPSSTRSTVRPEPSRADSRWPSSQVCLWPVTVNGPTACGSPGASGGSSGGTLQFDHTPRHPGCTCGYGGDESCGNGPMEW